MATFEIAWQAPEYEYREKGVAWYWLSIIIASVIVAFSVWQKNFLFGLFVVIAEVLFIVWGNKAPRLVYFSLTDTAVAVGRMKLYNLKEFESMSIDEIGNGWAEILFLFRARFKSPLKVLFPENRLPELREKMKTVLKEVPHEPTLLDAIEKLLRF